MTRRNIIKNVIGGILIIVLVFAVRSCFPPSQRSVVRRFERHRESFERITTMLGEDSNIHSIGSWGIELMEGVTYKTAGEAGLVEERYQEYRRLLRKTGAGNVIRDEDQIRFGIASSGFGSYGWRMALAYRESEPNNVIADLSEFSPDGTTSGWNLAYCPIADNWYIWIVW